MQDYSEQSILGYHTYLSRFLRKTTSDESALLDEQIGTFLDTEAEYHPQTLKYCRAALHLFFRMETGRAFKASSKTCDQEIEGLLQRFYDYSLDVKHIQGTTAVSEVSHVRSFLVYVFKSKSRYNVTELTMEDIHNFVTEQLHELSNSSKGRMITSIRNFFRFQLFDGNAVHASIFRLPLSPAVWRKSAFPTTLEYTVFNSLHKIPDNSTAVGKRNCSIILCFTELALRCNEVASLTIDDFNWREGYVTIRHTKNGAERKLPLSDKIGKSVIEYLMKVRPQSTSRILFVRFKHKRGEPMGCGQIRGVVRRNSARAGLEDKFCGTHILRRTAATKIYNSGNSLKMTADILGHESLDSTVRYAKTDITGLLTVASPWLGGECTVG